MLTGFPRTRWPRLRFSESYAVRISVKISRICEFRVIMGIMTGLLGCCSSSTLGSRANDYVKTLATLGFWLHHSPCSLGCWTNNTLAARSLSPKYIICDACGVRSPSLESSSVLYISPTDSSPLQNLILEGLEQKLQKSSSRCNKNTWHVESSYILQPPKYLLLFVNRFRYINNNFTKDRCPIPMDMTVRLGPLKLSLRAIIDHQVPSIHSGHCTASINCCKKHSIATITQLRSLELLITKTPVLHLFNYIRIDWHMIFGLEQEGGSLMAPMALAHPLHPIDNRLGNKRRNLWVGWCASSWWP